MPLLSTLHELLAALLSWKCCQHSHSIISPTSYYVPATRGPSHKYTACLQSPSYFPEYQLLFLLMFCISFEFSAPILFFFFFFSSLSHMAFYFYSAILKPMGVFRNPILTASYGRLFLFYPYPIGAHMTLQPCPSRGRISLCPLESELAMYLALPRWMHGKDTLSLLTLGLKRPFRLRFQVSLRNPLSQGEKSGPSLPEDERPYGPEMGHFSFPSWRYGARQGGYLWLPAFAPHL